MLTTCCPMSTPFTTLLAAFAHLNFLALFFSELLHLRIQRFAIWIEICVQWVLIVDSYKYWRSWTRFDGLPCFKIIKSIDVTVFLVLVFKHTGLEFIPTGTCKAISEVARRCIYPLCSLRSWTWLLTSSSLRLWYQRSVTGSAQMIIH